MGAQAGPGTESVLDPDAPIADASGFCRAGHAVGYRLSANEQAGRRPGQHGQGDRSSPGACRLRGQVRVGTASGTNRTLREADWYPSEADTPEQRLRYYARQFPLVEVD